MLRFAGNTKYSRYFCVYLSGNLALGPERISTWTERRHQGCCPDFGIADESVPNGEWRDTGKEDSYPALGPNARQCGQM